MSRNVSKRKPNSANQRSKALNITKRQQKLNLQKVEVDGKKVRMSNKEIKSMKKQK